MQQSRLHEDEILRARVEQLESAITERSEENIQLQVQLKSATKKLQLLNSNLTSKCYFDRLPDEIIHRIMNFMCSISLSNFACVDRYIRSCALEDSLWMSRFQTRWGPGIFEREHLGLNRVSSSNSTDKLAASNLPSTSLTRSRKWFRLYAKCRMIESNWKHFRCETHECRGHNGTVTCLVMTKERMISGLTSCKLSNKIFCRLR